MKRLLIALLLALTGGAVVWLLRVREPRNAPITLSDGTVLVFRGATYGTVHEYHGGGWRGRLARMLPEKWVSKVQWAWRARKAGAKVTTAQPSLTVWWERQGRASASLRYALGAGTHFAAVNTTHHRPFRLPSGTIIEGVGFNAFPRRGRTTTLRFYEDAVGGSGAKLAGEFTFRNPAHSDAPGWQPEPLPATRRMEDCDVMIEEVVAGVDKLTGGEFRTTTNIFNSCIGIRLRFSSRAEAVATWLVGAAELLDATGNKAAYQGWHLAHSFKNGVSRSEYSTTFPHHLWSDEGAWKMRLHLTRRANFAPDELWTVRGLPVGAADLTNQPAFGTNLQEATLQIQSVRAKADLSSTHELKLLLQPTHSDYRLTLLTVRDERGREALQSDFYYASGSHTAQLKLATNAQRLDVTLALHRSRCVEFLVAPKRFDAAHAGP